MFDPMGPILDGNLILAIPIALLAGFLAFVSPCILPLVPGYVGFISSVTGEGREGRRVSVAAVSLFVAGFALVFVLTTALVGAASNWILQWGDLVVRLGGVVMIALGLVFMGQFSFLQKIWKPKQTTKTGLWAAPLVGILFAIGWTPCSGPTLAAIGVLTLNSGSAWQGALLGLLYAIGLGIPFIAIALGLGWATKSVGWLRKHVRTINIIGGVLLMLLGLLMVTGVWTTVTNALQGWVVNFGTPL